MSWIISSNYLTRRDKEFEEKCKDDAVNKSIPIIDETDPKYFPYSEESLPIPIVIEELKIRKRRNYTQEIGIVEYVQNMSKKEEQILKEQIKVVAQKKKKKKKLQ